MFEGKTIVVGVSGGIAAYKAAQLVSDLAKTDADVHVLMTENAAEFVSRSPLRRSPKTASRRTPSTAITNTTSSTWRSQKRRTSC